MPYKEVYKTYLIESQAILERDEEGRRYPHGEVKYGRFIRWTRYNNPRANFRYAVRMVNADMTRSHVGHIVYRRVIKGGLLTNDLKVLYKAKWGHDEQPYTVYTALGKRWLR